MMGFIMAAIVGSTAGSQDIDSGVFRDLAATGRSRSALFLARVGGAWVVVGAILAITLAFNVAGAFALADGTATPALADIVQAVAMVFASGAVGAALAVGLAALFGSRGPVIGILIAAHLRVRAAAPGRGLPRRRAPGAPAVGDQPHRRRGERARLHGSRSAPPSPSSSRGSRPRWRPAHGAPGHARSSAGAQGRGYAPRVSPALPSWLRPPWARTVDVLVVLVVFVLVVPATIAQAAGTDEVLETALLTARRRAGAAGAPAHGRSWCSPSSPPSTSCSRSTARSGSR